MIKVITQLRFISLLFLISLIRSQTASEAIHLIENEVGYGARSLAMGGAYTAMGSDPSGMYWNPAGLADIDNRTLYLEFRNLNAKNKTTYLGQTKINPIGVGKVNGMGMAIPVPTIRGSLVLGLGFNRINHYDELIRFSGFSNYDNSLGFPINVDGTQQNHLFSKDVKRSEEIASIGSMEQLTFAFGIALSPNMSGGLSVSKVSGTERYDFEFIQEDTQNKYTEFPKDFKRYDLTQSLDTETEGWQIRGGMKFIITPWFRIGMNLSLPYKIKVIEKHGTNEFLSFDNGDNSDASENGYYDYKVKAPMIFDIGGAITVESLTVSSSFRIIDWKSTRFDLENVQLNSEDYLYLEEENNNLIFRYRQVSQVRLGFESLLEFSDTFGIALRGGYAFVPAPKKSDKGDKTYFSLGVGVPVGSNIILDGAAILSSWEKKSNDYYTPSGTHEEVSAVKIYFNLSYLF